MYFHGRALCNYPAWTTCGQDPLVFIDFEQKSQWSSLIVVVPECREDVVGEVYKYALDQFQGKATL